MSVGAWPPVFWVVRAVVGIVAGIAGLFGYKRKCPACEHETQHETQPKAPPPFPSKPAKTGQPAKPDHKPVPPNPYGVQK